MQVAAKLKKQNVISGNQVPASAATSRYHLQRIRGSFLARISISKPTFLVIVFSVSLASRPLLASAPDVTPDQARVLEAVRASSLRYTENLPNFICTQITHRQTSQQFNFGASIGGVSANRSPAQLPAAAPGLSGLNDVIQEKLTFFDQEEHYEVISVNGDKTTGLAHLQLQGAISAGEFGSELHNIFDPHSKATFTWDKIATVSGRRVYVFNFRVPSQNGWIVMFRNTDSKILAAYNGHLFVDTQTLQVLRITTEIELPVGFPITMSTVEVDYKPIEIAGNTYSLPSRSEVRMKDNSRIYVNQIEFKDYHKFTVQSTIHYDNGDPPKPE
jgi:hypothetical protein